MSLGTQIYVRRLIGVSIEMSDAGVLDWVSIWVEWG